MDNSKILSDCLKESRTFRFLEKFYDIVNKPSFTDDEEFFIYSFVLDFAKAIIDDFGCEQAGATAKAILAIAEYKM